jgi:hypothetical protein
MTSNIEKYRLEETIRRSFFKHRGNINGIIEETGLDPDYIRKISSKIRRGFSHDINFETACFISDALLTGREQRMIILEDRLNEILSKKGLISICHSAPVRMNSWEGEPRYKCKVCGADCEIMEADMVDNHALSKIITLMRKEDEVIGKFLAMMGLVASADAKQPVPVQSPKPVQSAPVPGGPQLLPPADQELVNKLDSLDEKQVAEIRRMVESKVNEAMDDPQKS